MCLNTHFPDGKERAFVSAQFHRHFLSYFLMPTALKEPAAYSHDFAIIQKNFFMFITPNLVIWNAVESRRENNSRKDKLNESRFLYLTIMEGA